MMHSKINTQETPGIDTQPLKLDDRLRLAAGLLVDSFLALDSIEDDATNL